MFNDLCTQTDLLLSPCRWRLWCTQFWHREGFRISQTDHPVEKQGKILRQLPVRRFICILAYFKVYLSMVTSSMKGEECFYWIFFLCNRFQFSTVVPNGIDYSKAFLIHPMHSVLQGSEKSQTVIIMFRPHRELLVDASDQPILKCQVCYSKCARKVAEEG